MRDTRSTQRRSKSIDYHVKEGLEAISPLLWMTNKPPHINVLYTEASLISLTGSMAHKGWGGGMPENKRAD